MRTSFHHQPEAQHPNFQLSTSWQADYPIFRSKADIHCRDAMMIRGAIDPELSSTGLKSRSAAISCPSRCAIVRLEAARVRSAPRRFRTFQV